MEQLILYTQLVLGLFLLLVFNNIKTRLSSEKVLFVYLLLLMFRTACALLANDDAVLMSFPYIIYFNQSTFFLDAVFIYVFVKSILRQRFVSIKLFLLLIPFILFTYLSVQSMLSIDKTKLVAYILENKGNNNPERQWGPIEIAYFFMVIIFNILLYVHSYLIFKKGRKTEERNLITINQLNYIWQRRFLNWWFILFCLPTITILFFIFLKLDFEFNYEIIAPICVLLLTLVFGMRKIKIKYEELKVHKKEISIKKIVNNQDQKYGTLKLSTDKIQELNVLVNKAIFEDKVYLNPELTIASFAESINKKPHLVSQVINSVYDANFQDFVNSFRIEHSKKLLLDNRDFKIVHIAFDSGFNSARTFSTQFKNKTGLTPSEYRRAHLVETLV